MFRRPITMIAALAVMLPSLALAASGLPDNTVRATALIANYSEEGNFIGWGSGFFVDEGIVITNKHVIQRGDWYRVYATGADEKVNFECYKRITKSDVRINLDDDVAYIRAFLPCEHGILSFAEDPQEGDALHVLGYPYRDSAEESTTLAVTTGTMIGGTVEGWLLTDAAMDFGNSGGPVVNAAGVLGVAVAKEVDNEGNYVAGFFIPSSVILDGLLYANDPRFGYTPRPVIPRSSSSSSSSRSSSLSSASSVTSAPRSSVRSSMSPLQERTCKRADKYRKDAGVWKRLNERLMKRYGFSCR